MIEIRTELEIPMAPADVWAFFSNTSNWPKIDRLLEDSRPGEPLRMGPSRLIIIRPEGLPPMRIKPQILVADQGHLCWRGAVPGFWGEHYFKAEAAAGGRHTRWIHGEKFGGLISRPILALFQPRIRTAYESFNRRLAEALKYP